MIVFAFAELMSEVLVLIAKGTLEVGQVKPLPLEFSED
jgi:hypothetical protein